MSADMILHRLGLRPERVAALLRQDSGIQPVRRRQPIASDTPPQGWSNRAKLTPDQVRAIRQKRKSGATYQALCREFGLSLGPMYRVCSRESYYWVA